SSRAAWRRCCKNGRTYTRSCCAGTASTRGAATSPRRCATWRFSSSSSRCSAGSKGGCDMAVVRIPGEGRSFHGDADVARALEAIGIDFARVDVPPEVAAAPAERVLATYAKEIAEMSAKGGYVTADVIDVKPSTPNLDAMLAKFSREHWHDEDEV